MHLFFALILLKDLFHMNWDKILSQNLSLIYKFSF